MPDSDVRERIDRPLVVMHLPKTAGTTLRNAIERAARDERVVPLYGQGQIDNFVRDERARETADVVIGHFPYGLHEHLPDTARYATLLRDPVDRMVSQYHYALTRGDHHWHEDVQGMTLIEFARWREANGATDIQTAWIARRKQFRDGDDPITSDDLETAIDHCNRRFAVVGLTDRFEESLAAICVAAGWKAPRYLNRRVVSSRPEASELDPRNRRALVEMHPYDSELVAYARRRLDAQVAEQGDDHIRAMTSLARRNGTWWRGVQRTTSAAEAGRNAAVRWTRAALRRR